jgi:predicted  nucleic acid-binding Zn-ribbon protein
MSQARDLFQLQQIDSQLDQACGRLGEIEAALNDNSAVRKASSRLSKAEEVFNKGRLALKRAEQDVQVQQEKIEKNQKALYGGSVRNPKELEDLQMESEALARYLSVLEDRQLEAMIAFEEADNQHKQAERNLAKVKKEVAAQNVDLSAEQETLQAEVVRLETQRTSAVEGIAAELLTSYDKLRRTRFGVAVTGVRDGSCEACGTVLSAALAQEARMPSKIAHCTTCGRILYTS